MLNSVPLTMHKTRFAYLGDWTPIGNSRIFSLIWLVWLVWIGWLVWVGCC